MSKLHARLACFCRQAIWAPVACPLNLAGLQAGKRLHVGNGGMLLVPCNPQRTVFCLAIDSEGCLSLHSRHNHHGGRHKPGRVVRSQCWRNEPAANAHALVSFVRYHNQLDDGCHLLSHSPAVTEPDSQRCQLGGEEEEGNREQVSNDPFSQHLLWRTMRVDGGNMYVLAI